MFSLFSGWLCFKLFQFLSCLLEDLHLFRKTETDLGGSPRRDAVEAASRDSSHTYLLHKIVGEFHIIRKAEGAYIGHDVVGSVRTVDAKS